MKKTAAMMITAAAITISTSGLAQNMPRIPKPDTTTAEVKDGAIKITRTPAARVMTFTVADAQKKIEAINRMVAFWQAKIDALEAEKAAIAAAVAAAEK